MDQPLLAGVLEEGDGSPIGPAAPPWGGISLLAGGFRRGLILAIGRPWLWAYALLAFLARGGILLVAAPIVALPTFIGLANLIGPTSVTASGPTGRLVTIVAVSISIVVVAILLGTLVAAAAEVALHRATAAPDPDDPGSGLLGPGARVAGFRAAGWRIVLRVAAARLVFLAPVAVVLGLSVPEYVAVGYQELVLPSDLAVPLPVRILVGSPTASVFLVVAWLVGEVAGGAAARRIVLRDAGVLGGIGRALVDVALAPIGYLGAIAAGVMASVLLLAPGFIAASMAWEYARTVLVDAREGFAVLSGTLLLAATWGVLLVLAGLAAAVRAALFSVAAAVRLRAR